MNDQRYGCYTLYYSYYINNVVESVHYGHLVTIHKWLDYQSVLIFQVSLSIWDHNCVDYAGVRIIIIINSLFSTTE